MAKIHPLRVREEPEKAVQRPAPDAREVQAIAAAEERYLKRPVPPAATVEMTANRTATMTPSHSDDGGWALQMCDAFGTTSVDFMNLAFQQLSNVAYQNRNEVDSASANAAFAAVAGVGPQNEAEAMLASQMAGTHIVAMEMLRRAKFADTVPKMQEYGTLATKLLRTYTAQMEMLAKTRRGGSQKVTVEHVHVYPGGQAIVGHVNTGGGRDANEKAHRPYGTEDIAALAFAPGAEMRCPDPQGEPVPVASRAEQAEMSHPRRGKGQWRA